METVKKTFEMAERYDFVLVKQKGNTLLMMRGEETLLLHVAGLSYDSHIQYSPDSPDTREAEWPIKVVKSKEFEELFRNTVGI